MEFIRSCPFIFVLCLGLAVATAEEPAATLASPPDLIDFRDPDSIASHRPILIAHRGGVVSDQSPECSLKAIRLAAQQGYDLVELDIQRSSDAVPMLFHDRNLRDACGLDGTIAAYRADQLEKIKYVNHDEHIHRLADALRVCQELKLGVMLDMKMGRDDPAFLLTIAELLDQHKLTHATVSISGSQTARRVLAGVRFTLTDEEGKLLRAGDEIDLRHRFWFGLPQRLPNEDVARLRGAGCLILPAINTFRYPTENHFALAKKDIERLTMHGVDGFQIDSIYRDLISE